MGKIGKKRHKNPSDFHWGFFWGIIVFIVAVYLSIWIGSLTEEEVYEIFANRELIGTASHRRDILFQRRIATTYGKTGMMLIPISVALGSVHYLWGQVARYRRYKHKRRLYHDGIIENVYDIYEDDYVPLLSWRRIKTLFDKEARRDKKPKYPSKRELKKRIRDLEEQYRKM
jgi:hypothetical protein